MVFVVVFSVIIIIFIIYIFFENKNRDVSFVVSNVDNKKYLVQNFKDKQDSCWTHSDQAPKSTRFECLQGLVSLTNNKNSSIVLYEGSHKLYADYFKGNNSGKNWQMKKVLNVSAGDLVLWDSRTFHQNQFGFPNCEERLVQYVCYFPRNHPQNTPEVQLKRLQYFEEYRTTSHWPCPIRPNSLQPSGSSMLIDYDSLTAPDLEDLKNDIIKLV